jgi:N4-(beta-N-acetylglucosaminyl)-L-asparaginase
MGKLHAVNGLNPHQIGTSTNGLTFRIRGRVGDSPIMGAGAYCDNDVGGAAATGSGDVMMRFLPALKAVEYMRLGLSPNDACLQALKPIQKYYPGTKAALACVNINGEFGGANVNWEAFTFSFQNATMPEPKVFSGIQ